jgi:hypothetical protein
MTPLDDRPSSQIKLQIALALGALRSSIPGGRNKTIIAALDTLAQHGDAAALAETEALLSSRSLSLRYGDRDDDPPDWDIDPQAFEKLAHWWERLGLAETRSAQLVADWLGDGKYFGDNGYVFFTEAAPLLAAQVAPLLRAALDGADTERRRRVVDGLGYTPSHEATATLIALLGVPDEPVRRAARWALKRSADHRETAGQIISALGSPMPVVRAEALQALAWFAGHAHRNSISFPVLFEQAFAAIVALLADSDPTVQQLAAVRVNAAGYHLDMLRPSRERALAQSLALPRLDLLSLLEHDDPAVARSALYLAGRCGKAEDAPRQAALAAKITALLEALRDNYASYLAALYALGRLGAVAAIPAIAPLLEQRGGFYVVAALVLARLGYAPATVHLTGLLTDLTYRDDAREALEALDPAGVLPGLHAQLDARRRGVQLYTAPSPAEARYLETYGDAFSLALLRQTENYHFVARHAGADDDALVATARRLERRLLAASGVEPHVIYR